MITMKTNGMEISNAIGRITPEIIKGYRESIKEIAIYGKNLAQSLAPFKTGGIRRGIHYRVFKSKVELISVVNSSMPYNFWVNQTPPFQVLHFRRRNRFFKVPQDVAYGKSAVSPIGRRINWTGTAGFFNIAREQMDGMIDENLNPKIERALNKR